MIEVATAAQLVYVDTDATDVEFSADGQCLFLRSWMDQGWTDVLDVKTLDVKIHLEGQQLTQGRWLDGLPVLLSTIYHQNG